MDFGQLLKEARKNKRATLREVAEAGGVSIGYISDIEHGRRRAPGMDASRAIERYLEIQDGSLVKAADVRVGVATGGKKDNRATSGNDGASQGIG